MKLQKKIFSICLALCLLASFCTAAYAADVLADEAERVATRAEAVTMLWEASGSPAPTGTKTPFTDVPDSATYRDAVLWAVEQGITCGVNSTSFGPDMPVTRTQMAAFLYRMAGQPQKTGEGAWYSDAVKWAFRNIMVFGDALPLGAADDKCLTSDAAAYIDRYFSAPDPETNDDIIILYTSDVHCGISSGFGYAGLAEIRQGLEEQGYTTILVDDGDALQGEAVGTLTKGSALIRLMDAAGYDLAVPGNHEFDFGMDTFLDYAGNAGFQYISCNFNKEGDLVFEPYKIIEAEGLKIAFVGVTTPKTLTSSTPEIFQDESGEYIYGFYQDTDGEKLYSAVQSAVDSARAEGADLVYVMGHLGNEPGARPWTYSELLANTTGIDVMFDGHAHDVEQVVMNNRDGKPVVRSACGTKFANIGYSHIDPEDGVLSTGLWSWNSKINATETIGIENDVAEKVREVEESLDDLLDIVIAKTAVPLRVYDPGRLNSAGQPLRVVRVDDTNLGDLVTDAFRSVLKTDVAVMNGGGIRADIAAGDIKNSDLYKVFPYGNMICVVELSGQQILDALEWGARILPAENGGFLQVSGMSYTVDTSVPSGCIADENGMCVGIEGPRRVSDVRIGGEPIDPEKRYTLASVNYILLQHGDGYTAFDGAALLQDSVKLDNQIVIEYIADTLGGEIGSEYADPRGQGRISIR